jgi:thiol:disulfide interchange protein
MKLVLTSVFAIILVCSPAMAQTSHPAKNVVSQANVATEKTSAPIQREKFDPARDPAADLAKAVEQATAENKRIILDIGGEWCVWCRYMDRFFVLNNALNSLKEKNFVWVKVNMSEENDNKAFLSAYPEIAGYPHFFILDEKGKLLQSQSTDVLESDKTYSLHKFTALFKLWAPPEKKLEKKAADK